MILPDPIMPHVVDLGRFQSGDARVFAGRTRGANVRAKARLDELEADGDVIQVLVPEGTFSVNSSFFLGMFEQSIRRLGETEFRNRYKFMGADIDETIEDGIAEAQKSASPLQQQP